MCFLCDLKSPPAASTAPASTAHGWSSRRGFLLAGAAVSSAAAGPAWAQVDVGKASAMRKLVPASELEGAATQQYGELMQQAKQQGALLPAQHRQVQRLREIAQRLIPQSTRWNSRADGWRWEVNLIQSDQINAFCMPGGKIAFYTGILDKLQLTDDETAMIMGHEMAHALREHARERLAKTTATNLGLRLGAELLGLGNLGNVAADLGSQLLTLRFSREDESEADLVGLELASRGAYKPSASVSLWQKMEKANGRNGLPFLSTHPSGPQRIATLQANVPKVIKLYEQARGG